MLVSNKTFTDYVSLLNNSILYRLYLGSTELTMVNIAIMVIYRQLERKRLSRTYGDKRNLLKQAS